MFLVSDYDVVVGLDRQLIIGFSLAAIIAAFIFGGVLIRRMAKSEIKTLHNYFLGLALFCFMVAISRLILLYHDYFAADALDEPLWRAGMLFSILGLLFLNLIVETYVFTKTKHLISLLGAICILLFIILEKGLATIIAYGAGGILVVLPLGIYIYLSKTSTGDLRKQAVLIVIGMILLLFSQLGMAILFELEVVGRTLSQVLAFSITIIGMLFLISGFWKGPASASA